jgi:hypothetical protein
MLRVFLLTIVAWCLHGVSAEAQTVPELEGPRNAYQEALGKIRSSRDEQTAQVDNDYFQRLEGLRKLLATTGNTEGSAAVQAEGDRVTKGTETPEAERRKMTGLLLALRIGYEKARAPAFLASAKQELEAHTAWANGLAQLEVRLAAQGLADRVGVVKAERSRAEQAKAAAAASVASAAALIPGDKAASPTNSGSVGVQPSVPALAPAGEQAGYVEQMNALAKGKSGSPLTLKDEKVATEKTFKPPVDILVEAMTDSTNLRLSYAADQLIFNWELNRKQLRIDGGPAHGKHTKGAGLIPTNEFVTVRWTVTPEKQSVFVNGELRFEHEGDYSKIDKPIKVYSAHGSVVTLRSIKVKQLSEASAQ